jgi:HK97 family phage major capsid protein
LLLPGDEIAMDHRFNALPILLAIAIAVAAMPTNVLKVCYGGMGFEYAQPWRSKALAFVGRRVRTWLTRLRALIRHPLAVPAACAILLLLIALLAPAAASGSMLATVAGLPNIKQLKQDRADTDTAVKVCQAAQAKLKTEARGIFATAADKRTPEQSTRLTAIDATLDTLVAQEAELTATAAGIATELQRAERYADDERRQGNPTVTLGQNRAEQAPWGPEVPADAPKHLKDEARHLALGTFAQAVRMAALGQGVADPRLQAAATGAGTQTDSQLGFAIPNEVAPGIERDMFEGGDVLSRVDARTITGNAITYNVVDQTSRADGSRQGGVLGYWVDEGTAPTASNTKLAKLEMKLRKVGAFGVMTDELLADAIALGGELEAAFAAELIFQVENKIYRGNGASAPQGFLNAPCLVSVAKETNQVAATINTTNISKMWARMPARSKKNAAWFINVDCEPQLDELAQAIGTGGTAPRFVTYSDEGVLRIKGRPVIPVEYAETVGTQGDLALLDLSKYRLIRKGGVEQASSMHVYFAQGEQAFRAFYRVDGQMVPRAALTPFKGTATLSPAVVLDTRS